VILGSRSLYTVYFPFIFGRDYISLILSLLHLLVTLFMARSTHYFRFYYVCTKLINRRLLNDTKITFCDLCLRIWPYNMLYLNYKAWNTFCMFSITVQCNPVTASVQKWYINHSYFRPAPIVKRLSCVIIVSI